MSRGRKPELRAAMVRALSAEPFLCWDCRSARFRISFDGARVTLYHLRECPVLRSSWLTRCADDYIRALLIMSGISLADYSLSDEVKHLSGPPSAVGGHG